MRLTQPTRNWNSFSMLYPQTASRGPPLLIPAGSWRDVGPKPPSGSNEGSPLGTNTAPLATCALADGSAAPRDTCLDSSTTRTPLN